MAPVYVSFIDSVLSYHFCWLFLKTQVYMLYQAIETKVIQYSSVANKGAQSLSICWIKIHEFTFTLFIQIEAGLEQKPTSNRSLNKGSFSTMGILVLNSRNLFNYGKFMLHFFYDDIEAYDQPNSKKRMAEWSKALQVILFTVW